ncbi:MAG: UDP-2,3-diacylglucosamine diphosphatase LpxI [Spirochaetota bacterium]
MINTNTALIAGDGSLPLILAQRLNDSGILSLVIVLQGNTERFGFIQKNIFESAPGKIKNIINILKKHEIKNLIMIGKIDKNAFLERKGFDLKALKLLKSIKNGNDMSIFYAVERELKNIGVEILPQDLYLKDLLVKKGAITGKKPSKKDMLDAQFGLKYAKQIASMDIGQAVVVKNQVITAVEAVEGSDETIRRGAGLAKTGSVVCKAARAKQDKRFDIPAVGLDTIKLMFECKCSLLALEADSIFIVNPKEVIDYANSKKISIIGI